MTRTEAPRRGKLDLASSRLRLAGVVLLCAKIALVPLVFDSTADIPFVVPKALVSHALAYALMGVLLGLFVQFGRSFFVWSWLHVPVLAFLAANVLATAFAGDRLLALYGAHVRMLGLGTIADCVVLYFAIVLLVRTRADAVAVLLTALGTSVVVLLYELIQFARLDPFVFGADSSLRPFSTIGQTNVLAEYLTVVAVGIATLALLQPGVRMPLRVALLGYSILLVAGVVPTLTRAAFIGLAAGSAIVVALVFLGHPSPRARAISALGAGLATAALVVLLLFTPLGARFLSTIAVEPQQAAATETGGDEPNLSLEDSAQTRLALYRIAFEMVRERPLLGFGPDNLAVGVPRFRSEHEPSEVQQSQPTSPHSWLAQVALGSGLLGLGSFLATIGLAFFLTLKRGFLPVAWAAMAMVVAFLGAGILTINDVSTEWLLWASIGTVAAATARPSAPVADAPALRARDRPPVSRPSTSRRVAAWTFALVGIALVVFAPSAHEASRRAQFAQEARLAGRYPQAIDASLLATRYDPGRAEYWDGLALGYIGAQRIAEGAAAFEQATKLAPYSVRLLGQLARAYIVLAQRGDRAAGEKARELADRLAALDPNNERSHETKALVLQISGDLPGALRSVERAFAIAPRSGNAALYVTASQVYLASGRIDDAIQVARQGTVFVAPLPSVDIRVELARALAAKGQPKEAVAELDQALLIQPGHRAATALRAEISSRIPSS